MISAFAQTPGDPPQREGDRPPFGDGPPREGRENDDGPRSFASPGNRGPGGFGGVQGKQKLVQQFDKDGDQRLNAAERRAAPPELSL